MNPILAYVVCAIASYLLGAIPFGLLVSRARGIDIRKVGSGNIGATNVFRCVGKRWGLLTFFLDALKGFVPAFAFSRLALHLSPGANLEALKVCAAMAAIAGHNWPVYLRFKGGKGMATSAGALLGIAPLHIAIGLLVWILAFLSSRYVSVASILAAVGVAASAWLLPREGGGLLLPSVLSILAALAIWRHKSNIRRLTQGTENRFNFKRKKAASGESASPPAA